jgi:hypothetical protein
VRTATLGDKLGDVGQQLAHLARGIEESSEATSSIGVWSFSR